MILIFGVERVLTTVVWCRARFKFWGLTLPIHLALLGTINNFRHSPTTGNDKQKTASENEYHLKNKYHRKWISSQIVWAVATSVQTNLVRKRATADECFAIRNEIQKGANCYNSWQIMSHGTNWQRKDSWFFLLEKKMGLWRSRLSYRWATLKLSRPRTQPSPPFTVFSSGRWYIWMAYLTFSVQNFKRHLQVLHKSSNSSQAWSTKTVAQW